MALLSHYPSFVSRRRFRPIATPTALSLLLALLLLAAVLCLPDRVPTAFGQSSNQADVADVELNQVGPRRPISFRDRLVAGLQARLKSEVAFVDAVVDEVQAGNLPQRLVDQTFFWARQRASVPRQWGRTRRPIIYFRPALAARAKRLGVVL